ncbi:hypothetical protein BN1708_011939 [Verticillium longisporum]|uniref:Uncharacterized protein n=1 Tax=Verticillium longisporum TaxID=100787 RepID=A0A0G4L571_VERLO|nr:hypothetical protein BN1708_011939 [Verticillium longisporum]
MASQQRNKPDEPGPVSQTMKQDPTLQGFFHVGIDGVVRSMSGSYTVRDARGLSAVQIANIIAHFPLTEEERGRYHGVDGSNITGHDELYHPAPGILPKKPTEAERDERRRIVEAYEKEREESGGSVTCRLPEADGMSAEDRLAQARTDIEERNALLEEKDPTLACCKPSPIESHS